MTTGVAQSVFSARSWANDLLTREPDRVLLVSKRRSISASGLRDDVCSLRAGLAAAAVASGDIVAIAAEREEQAIAVWLACLSSGVIPFFVDPRHDTDVLMKLMDAVRVQGLYCGTSLDKSSFQSRLPYLKWFGEKSVAETVSPETSSAPTESAAFIVHSAGTCGPPRAIFHHENAIVWHAKALINALRLKPEAELWFSGSLASASVQSMGLFAILSCGGVLVLDDPAESLAISARKRSQSILLLAEVRDTNYWNADKLLSIKGNVSAVLVTDSVLTEEYAQLISKATDAVVWTGFYSAETAGFVALNTIPGVWPTTSAGRAIGGAEFAIAGNDASRLQSDSIGRLIVRDCPRPLKISALTFRAGAKNDGVDYAVTGDWARLDDQDYLYYEGCERSVFEKAGFQIRVLQIEQSLRDINGIRDAVVFGVPADEIENEIAASIVVAGPPPDFADVRREMETRMPRFAVPVKFSINNSFRTTPSGKRIRFGLESSLRGLEKNGPANQSGLGPIIADSLESSPPEGGNSAD